MARGSRFRHGEAALGATGPRSTRLIGERLAVRTTAQWVEILTEHGVPVGPVNDIAQTFADPQVGHLGLTAPVDHATLGTICR